MTRSESEAERWTPDELLVPALLAGSPTTMDDLNVYDRAWVVAVLKLEGLTAEQMKERLDCSLRLVRTVAADAGAVMARLYLVERETFADTLRLYQADVRRLEAERIQATSSAQRYKAQLDRLLDRLQTTGEVPTFPKCGHPRTRYNTYKAPKTGKENCRMCHALAQADYRLRKAITAEGHNGAHGAVETKQVEGLQPIRQGARSVQRSPRRSRLAAQHGQVKSQDRAAAR